VKATKEAKNGQIIALFLRAENLLKLGKKTNLIDANLTKLTFLVQTWLKIINMTTRKVGKII